MNMRIKENKNADILAKQAIDMPGMIITRLPYTDYYLRARDSEWQRNEKTELAN